MSAAPAVTVAPLFSVPSTIIVRTMDGPEPLSEDPGPRGSPSLRGIDMAPPLSAVRDGLGSWEAHPAWPGSLLLVL